MRAPLDFTAGRRPEPPDAAGRSTMALRHNSLIMALWLLSVTASGSMITLLYNSVVSKSRHIGVPVGDTDRKEARALLDVHYAKGRLTTAEHEKRHALAGVARFWADVAKLFADLPAPHPQRDGAPSPAPVRTEPAAERVETTVSSVMNLILSLCGVAGLPAALVLTVYYGAWWSILVLGVVVLVAAALAADAHKNP